MGGKAGGRYIGNIHGEGRGGRGRESKQRERERERETGKHDGWRDGGDEVMVLLFA